MGVPLSKWDHDYCGILAWAPQPRDGFSVTLGIGLNQVEIRSSNFPIDLKNSLDSRYQSISFKDVSSGPSICSMEIKLIEQRDRCLPTIMEESKGYTFPPHFA